MKFSLQPFPGCYSVTILVPPIMAALYCATHGFFHCVGQIPNGPVAFAVFIDAPGETVEDATQWALDNAQEIAAEARKLMVSSIYLN